MSEKSEKPKGRTMNEIIIDMEKGSGSHSQNQVGRILEEQTEMMARRVQKSEMEQIMAESERKKIEEENRLKLAREGQMPAEPQPREAPQEAKNILDAVKVGLEAGKPQQQQGSIGEVTKSLAEMFKVGVEVGRGQAQPQVQQQNPLEAYKVVQEMMRPVLDELKATREHNTELRMKEIESKIVNPIEYIETVKKSAQSLGLTSGGKTAVDIEIEKMQQVERLDNRKLDFEMKKFDKEAESGDRTIELIKGVMEGPVGKVIDYMGKAGADRIRLGKPATGNNAVITCPNELCRKDFYGDSNAPEVVCPHCHAVLKKLQAPQPPPQTQEPAPAPQPQESAPSSQQTEEQQPAPTDQPPT